MQIFIEFGTYILTAYLALTGAMANSIQSWLGPEATEDIAIEIPETTISEPLAQLVSAYNHESNIPDVLLKNAAFQSAAAIAGASSDDVTYNPEEAMVNVFCTYTTDEFIKTTTGSGFFISRSGAVLTNAHVAQTLLLENADRPGTTTCMLRTGNPATTTYTAKLLYIPPAWIQANANLIDAAEPKGTGERDYALLYAASRIDNQPLPAAFPHLKLHTDLLTRDDQFTNVEALGYPATATFRNSATGTLALAKADSTITELYTYSGDNADLMSLKHSAVAAGGSSGGPVVKNGRAIGMIVTQGLTEDDGLRAITMPYINNTLKEETGFTLTEYTHGDLAFKANTFATALAPFLQKLLEFQLND